MPFFFRARASSSRRGPFIALRSVSESLRAACSSVRACARLARFGIASRQRPRPWIGVGAGDSQSFDRQKSMFLLMAFSSGALVGRSGSCTSWPRACARHRRRRPRECVWVCRDGHSVSERFWPILIQPGELSPLEATYSTPGKQPTLVLYTLDIGRSSAFVRRSGHAISTI